MAQAVGRAVGRPVGRAGSGGDGVSRAGDGGNPGDAGDAGDGGDPGDAGDAGDPAKIRTLADYRAASKCAPGFLNFAAIGPLLAPVSRARAVADDMVTRHPDRLGELETAADRALALAAQLLAIDPAQVALSPNTSSGLFQAAFAMPPGEVLVSPFDFPANTQPWRRAEEWGGPSVRWLADTHGPRPAVTPELIAEALTPKSVAVAISAVDFATGECVDLPGIRDVIGDRILVVDAIQGLGAVDMPWDVADVVASGGQKWLRGGWGSGVLACSARAVERFGPGLSGWSGAKGTDDPSSLAVLAAPRDDVARFSMTAPDLVAMAGFAAALEVVQSVGIAAISERITQLTHRLRAGLADAGAAVISSDTSGRDTNGSATCVSAKCGTAETGTADDGMSGITSFSVHGRPPTEIVSGLARAGITVCERQSAVRVSIHASTDEDVIDRLISEVGKRTAKK